MDLKRPARAGVFISAECDGEAAVLQLALREQQSTLKILLTEYSSTDIFRNGYDDMEWDVEYTDAFETWWNSLTEAESESVRAHVLLLRDFGPGLRFPYTSGIRGSRHGHMRELRVQHGGRPFRVLYAFDPQRCAILLVGGEKRGERWYRKYIPIADRLYDRHLKTLNS